MGFFPILLAFMLMITTTRQQEWYEPSYDEQFELATMNYRDSPEWMDEVSDITRADEIVSHPLLPEQFLWLPPNPWIFKYLRGRAIPGGGHEDIILAIRSDNKYCIGFFSFNDARWHAFQGEEKFFPRPISLGFNTSYGSLVGGWRNLQYLAIGKTPAEQAVSVLYWIDMKVTPERLLKRSCAALIFMFIESHRFYPIRDFVDEHWNDAMPKLIPLYLAEYTVHWKDISCAVSYWAKTNDWSSGQDAKDLALSRTIPIRSPGEALAIIYPILQGKTCKQYPPIS